MQFIRKEAGPHVEEAAETHQIATMHGSQPPAGHDASLPATARIARRLQRTAYGDFCSIFVLPSCIEYRNMYNNNSRTCLHAGRQDALPSTTTAAIYQALA